MSLHVALHFGHIPYPNSQATNLLRAADAVVVTFYRRFPEMCTLTTT